MMEQVLEEIDRQIRTVQARQRKEERKRDTRRKVIAGALALDHAEKDEQFARVLYDLIALRYARARPRPVRSAVPGRQRAADHGSGEGRPPPADGAD